MKTISILGCGWMGLPLGEALAKKDFIVKGSTTTLAKQKIIEQHHIKPFLVDMVQQKCDPNFFECDILIIAIPPNARSGNN